MTHDPAVTPITNDKPALDSPVRAFDIVTVRRATPKGVLVSADGVSREYPFADFQPVHWVPGDGSEAIDSVKRDHGVGSSYRLHNPKDEVNETRQLLSRVLVEYHIGANRYDLFTVGDLLESGYAFEPSAGGNIMGDTAERISRRITKYFLQHFHRDGRTGGIFDKRFDPKNRDNFIVAHTDRHVLKIDRYPNLIILRKSGKGKYGYENIKELDGLFDYRFRDQRHFLVLESKLDRIKVDRSELVENLFAPLREFFPEAQFSYVLFSSVDAIYVKRDFGRRRRLRHTMQVLCDTLRQEGVGVLFFTFNESYSDFERIRDHLITQYRSIAQRRVVLHGKMMISDREIALFDGGETPHLKLVRDSETGLWREIPMKHKKRREALRERPKAQAPSGT
jgi:hypothetical protein